MYLNRIKHWARKNKLLDLMIDIKLSMRSKIIIAFIIVIVMMSLLNVAILYSALKYGEQYDTIVSNITTANRLNGIVKNQIDAEMWDIVAGKIKFEKGRQYEIINNINNNIYGIMQNVRTHENRVRLDVTLRTMSTLTKYVDLMGKQIRDKKTVEENEKVLENIRGVSSLVEDNIQEFILYEISSSETIKTEIDQNIKRWVFTNLIVLGLVLLFSTIAAWVISGSISKPIRELYKMTKSVAQGNLDVRVKNRSVDEIAHLGMSFNIMVQKIKELLEKNKAEQENLKKTELKMMQAQINPHFLYNTLDTIVWMAEANKSKQVIEIVRALSSFFRITLSKGKDWISIRDEIAHITSYLTIQKIRYRDILDFNVEVSDDILDYKILKLTLQPLVENSLYHGIKNKREGGIITIRGYKGEGHKIIFEVMDNGAGMPESRYKEVVAELESNSKELIFKESGFGLNNVHKRIKLYYGDEYGISIKSELNKGTRLLFAIPLEV